MDVRERISSRRMLLFNHCVSSALGAFHVEGAGRFAVLCMGRETGFATYLFAPGRSSILLRYCVAVVIKHYRCASGISI